MAKNARESIGELLHLLTIDENEISDPDLIAQVLNEDMLLQQFEPAQQLLAEALQAPVDFKPTIDKTINGIMTKQPAIQDFIVSALEQHLIDPVATEKGKAEIKRSLHHLYVLNKLIEAIVEDLDFTFAIQEHLINQRTQFGISKNLVEALETLKNLYKGSMFEPTKIIGMDMVYKARALDRQKGIMTPEAEQAQIDGLTLNILEASITDAQAGFTDNALVGAVLSQIHPTAVTLTHDERRVMLFHLSRRWTSLYETWNLAFCLGNLAYPSILLPKLLAPAVIDAPAERYLITRSAGLWCSTLFHQFATLSKRENVEVPHAQELARLWGSINLSYAETLAIEEDCRKLGHYETALNITMGQIMEAMKDSMIEMPLTDDERERLIKVYE